MSDETKTPEEPLLRHLFDPRLVHPALTDVARPFAAVAQVMCSVLPKNAQRDDMLKHLVYARDCAVRSHVDGADVEAKPDIKIVSADGVIR